MDLRFKIRKTILDNGLIEAGDHLLIAVSGGIDSMTLLFIFDELRDDIGYTISVAHINHKLRGKDSDADEGLVEGYCRKRRIPFYSVDWKGVLRGENLQEAARRFRYSSLSKISSDIGAAKIATAHNLDDQAETVLLNVIRGSGLDGLTGMHMTHSGSDPERFIIRPLLGTSREEIANFAKMVGIEFREDVTNDQVKYTRNFIRHRIIPLIREINPNAVEAIARMSEFLRRDEGYISAVAVDILDQISSGQDDSKLMIDNTRYQGCGQPVRTRILKMAYARVAGTDAGLSSDHILKMDEIAVGKKWEGSYSLPRSLRFEKRGRTLAIFKE